MKSSYQFILVLDKHWLDRQSWQECSLLEADQCLSVGSGACNSEIYIHKKEKYDV